MSTAIARGHNPTDSSRKRRWRTPPAFFQAMAEEHNFILDAAAEPGAQLVRRYIAPPTARLDHLAADQLPVGVDCLVTPWARQRTDRWSWFNSPWGPAFSQCPPDCTKAEKNPKHVHHTESFPGTEAFMRAAIRNSALMRVLVLVSTCPDTAWWRAAFRASFKVRLLPRVSFLDPDTGEEMGAPPGAGVTLFSMDAHNEWLPLPSFRPRVVLADKFGRIVPN